MCRAVVDEETVLDVIVLPNDILQEAVPGNIRRAEHFIAFMKKVSLTTVARAASDCMSWLTL